MNNTKIMIEESYMPYQLEEEVNNMLKRLEKENDIIDIKFSTTVKDEYCKYSVMIIFKKRIIW